MLFCQRVIFVYLNRTQKDGIATVCKFMSLMYSACIFDDLLQNSQMTGLCATIFKTKIGKKGICCITAYSWSFCATILHLCVHFHTASAGAIPINARSLHARYHNSPVFMRISQKIDTFILFKTVPLNSAQSSCLSYSRPGHHNYQTFATLLQTSPFYDRSATNSPFIYFWEPGNR